jgi:hypothetical protein
MKGRPSAGKTMCENELRDSQGYCRRGKPITGRICKYIANLRRNIARKRKEDEDVEENAPMHIESRESVSLRILFLFLNRTYISPLFSVIISKSILFRRVCGAHGLEGPRLGSSISRILSLWNRHPHPSDLLRRRTVVNVLVLMFSRQM